MLLNFLLKTSFISEDVKAEIKGEVESNKEKIVVNEALEDVAGMRISTKTDEDSKSVASNKQM